MLKFIKEVEIDDSHKVLKTLIGISLLVMSFGTLFSSYLQQNYSETISYYLRDGWCKAGSQGFGIHCFSDFYEPMTVASSPSPWSNDLNLAYTPLNFFYFKILGSGIVTDLGTHISLILNLGLTLIALSIPGVYILMRQNNFKAVSGKWVLLISLTSGPSLMMIDRGNSSFLLFPIVFFFYLGIQKQNQNMCAYSLIAMGLWKPQSLILAVGILIFFGIRPFLIVILKFCFVFIFSFLLYPSKILENFTNYLQNSRDYQNYVPSPTFGNYSFVNFLGFIRGILLWAIHGFSNIENVFRPPLNRDFVSLFCAIYATLVFVLFILARNRITKFQFVLQSSIFMLTIAGTTFGYYLTLMLIPLVLFSRNQLVNEIKVKGNRLSWRVYVLFLFLSVPAWPFTWANIPGEIGDSWSSLGFHWILVHAITSLLVLLSLLKLSTLAISGIRQREK
jgi:hypothetical protein